MQNNVTPPKNTNTEQSAEVETKINVKRPTLQLYLAKRSVRKAAQPRADDEQDNAGNESVAHVNFTVQWSRHLGLHRYFDQSGFSAFGGDETWTAVGDARETAADNPTFDVASTEIRRASTTTRGRRQNLAITSLVPALCCRSCRPNAPFAELLRLSRLSVLDEVADLIEQTASGIR